MIAPLFVEFEGVFYDVSKWETFRLSQTKTRIIYTQDDKIRFLGFESRKSCLEYYDYLTNLVLTVSRRLEKLK